MTLLFYTIKNRVMSSIHQESITMRTENQILSNIYEELELKRWHLELADNQSDNQRNDLFKIQQRLPRTELTAAEEIARKFKNHLTFIPTETRNGTWYVWDGYIHRPLAGDTLVMKIVMEYQRQTVKTLNMVKDTIERRADELENNGDESAANKVRALYEGEWKKFRNFRDDLAKDRNQASVLKQMKRLMDQGDDYFLDDRRWFVIEDGVYDLEAVRRDRRFDLLPHDASRPVFRMWNIKTQPGKDYPHLSTFLTGSIADASQAKFFSKAVAAACFGAPTSTKTLVSLQGATNSGKSMVLRVIKKITEGSDFYAAPPREAIVANGRSAAHARFKMRRARLVAFSEIRSDLDSEFVLNYTGGDDYGVEEKYIESTTVAPQGIIFMASNKGVQVDKTDEAMFARIAPINFPHTFVKGIDETPDLEKLIIADSAGFLEWMKWSYLEYLKEGLDKSDSMEALKRDERETDSSAFQYIDALLENNALHFDVDIPKSHSVTLKELHENYVMYCSNHAVKHSEVLSQRAFKKHLQVRYEVDNTAGYRVYGLKYAAETVRKF